MTVPTAQKKENLPARRRAKSNAFKHGVFSSIELLPWEDGDAFEQLRLELWNEHKPEGPSQEDAVETILWCRWRKLRLRSWRKFETAAALSKVENRVFEQEPPPLFDTEAGKNYALIEYARRSQRGCLCRRYLCPRRLRTSAAIEPQFLWRSK